jgi:hypothetical protein
LSRKRCDDNFHANMLENCKQHFFRHVKNRKAINKLNLPGYNACKSAAHAFYRAVQLGGESSYHPSRRGACKSIPR